MLWKKPERGENDGIKESFKMNKDELELCNLVDLAFVSQDYETAMNNAKFHTMTLRSAKHLGILQVARRFKYLLRWHLTQGCASLQAIKKSIK